MKMTSVPKVLVSLGARNSKEIAALSLSLLPHWYSRKPRPTESEKKRRRRRRKKNVSFHFVLTGGELDELDSVSVTETLRRVIIRFSLSLSLSLSRLTDIHKREKEREKEDTHIHTRVGTRRNNRTSLKRKEEEEGEEEENRPFFSLSFMFLARWPRIHRDFLSFHLPRCEINDSSFACALPPPPPPVHWKM